MGFCKRGVGFHYDAVGRAILRRHGSQQKRFGDDKSLFVLGTVSVEFILIGYTLVFGAFQCMFAALTPALITGAFAERMKFKGLALLMILWAIFIYNPMAHMSCWVFRSFFFA